MTEAADEALAALPDPLPVGRATALMGAVRVPGSKSLSARALVLAGLAKGTSRLQGLLDSDDTRALAMALQAIGVQLGAGGLRGDSIELTGCDGAPTGGATVHCADGGTPARFLLAVAALARQPVTVDGSARLRERPMGDGVALLRALGVECRHAGREGFLPIEVRPGRRPTGGDLEVGRTASSQFVSGLLLVAPWLARGLTVRFVEPPVSATYIELTLDELARWGVAAEVTRTAAGVLQGIRVPPAPPPCRVAAIEPDASSAVFWTAAAAIVPGSRLVIQGLPRGSRQPDMGAVGALSDMGALVRDHPPGLEVGCAATRLDQPPLRGIERDCSDFPDGALAVAAAAAVAAGPSRLLGLGTLRVKECDRVHALAHNLEVLGATVRQGPDWLEIHPIATPRPATLPTFNDHRVAMAFAVLALRLGGAAIADPRCVAKSYPGFWRDLQSLAPGVLSGPLMGAQG